MGKIDSLFVDWLFLSIFSAFSLATADALTKLFFSKLPTLRMSGIRVVFALPFLLPILLFLPWPRLDTQFWLSLAVLYPLEVTALILYMLAIKLSPLSLSLPFLSFTPVFLIFTGWLFLNESPNIFGILGIILIFFGTYLLYLPKGKGISTIMKGIIREKGSWLMLLVSFIYAITSALGKFAILHSSPLFFGPFYYIGLAIIFMPFVLDKPGLRFDGLSLLKAMSIGLFVALMIISHVIAISKIEAVYMISVKRLSPLFGVIYGGIFFKEEYFGIRLFATALMCLGCMMIYLFGH